MPFDRHITWPLPASQLKPALQLIRALARADMTVLLLHDDANGTLLPVAGSGMSDAQCALIGSQRDGAWPFGLAVSEKRRVVVPDAWSRSETLSNVSHALGFRSIEILPLYGIEGQTVGALALMYRHTREASRRVLKLIEACAALVVLAVLHARRAVAAERERANAEMIGRARVQFVARMSHELRTPLQSIAGYIDLLGIDAAEPLTPAQQRLLEHVRDSEKLLVHVIDDLITFSRLEAGHITYEFRPVLACDVLRSAEGVVAPLATNRGVTLAVSGCEADATVHADGDKVKQILVNLAANAVKFTERDGFVRLSCRVEPTTISFDVEDTGPGIPPERLGDIFEPYVQLGAPLHDRYGGTGLGLAISNEFATGMGGHLSVSSTVGRGSVFTLQLPRELGTPVLAMEHPTREERRSA